MVLFNNSQLTLLCSTLKLKRSSSKLKKKTSRSSQKIWIEERNVSRILITTISLLLKQSAKKGLMIRAIIRNNDRKTKDRLAMEASIISHIIQTIKLLILFQTQTWIFSFISILTTIIMRTIIVMKPLQIILMFSHRKVKPLAKNFLQILILSNPNRNCS